MSKDICKIYVETLKKLSEEGKTFDYEIERDIYKIQLLTKQLDHAVQACIIEKEKEKTMSYKLFGIK